MLKIDNNTAIRIDCNDIHSAVPIKVCYLGHPDGGLRWSERYLSKFKARLLSLDLHITLAAISMRYRKVDKAVVIEISWCDGRRRII